MSMQSELDKNLPFLSLVSVLFLVLVLKDKQAAWHSSKTDSLHLGILQNYFVLKVFFSVC